jgi:hypothetical protein
LSAAYFEAGYLHLAARALTNAFVSDIATTSCMFHVLCSFFVTSVD